MSAVLGKHMAKVWSSYKTCHQVILVCSYIFNQSIKDSLSVLFSCQAEEKRYHCPGLCLTYDTSCRGIILTPEGFKGLFIKLRVALFGIGMSENFGCLSHNIGHIQIVSICYKILVCRTGPVSHLLLIQRKPVTVLKAGLPKAVIAAVIPYMINPFMHALPGI